MNKILLTIFVFFCLFFSILNVNAIGWSDFKAFVFSKKELSETVKWKQYIYKMDQILDKVSNNGEALEKLKIKIESLKVEFNDTGSIVIKNIINYLYWKTLILIEQLTEIEQENSKKIFVNQYLEADIKKMYSGDIKKQKIAYNYAKELEKILNVNDFNEVNLEKFLGAVDCMSFNNMWLEDIIRIEFLVLNSDEKHDIYMSFNDSQSGKFFGGDIENLDCDFE